MKSLLTLMLILLASVLTFAADTTQFVFQNADLYLSDRLIEGLDRKRDTFSDEVVFKAFETAAKDLINFNLTDEAIYNHQIYFGKIAVLKSCRYYRQSDWILYESMGNCMLDLIADTLQKAIDKREVDYDHSSVAYVIHHLGDFDYQIDIPVSNFTKTMGYLKEGRFGYVWHKLTTTYQDVLLTGVGVFVALFLLFFYIKKRFRMKNKTNENTSTESVEQITSAPQNGPNIKALGTIATMLLCCVLSADQCCAQPPTTVPYCTLIEQEAQIDQVERMSRDVRARIQNAVLVSDSIQVIAVAESVSIWTHAGITKPTIALAGRKCDSIHSDIVFLDDLRRLKVAAGDTLADLLRREALLQQNGTETKTVSKKQQSFSKPESLEPKSQTNLPKPESFVQEHELTAKPHIGKSVIYKELQYDCSFVNPKSSELKVDFLWKDRAGHRFGSFDKCTQYLKAQGKEPIMLINAGMFNPDFAPVGLFYSNGKKLRRLNNDKGDGNFFLEPNGVFIIEKSGKAVIKTTEHYLATLSDTVNILHATQSGPMLLIDGAIHPAFNPQSTNLHIRHGVGIQADGTVVFAISQEKVSFHEFALFFKYKLKCSNALYLDGTISAMFLPAIGLDKNRDGFSGIIAISKPHK